MEISLDYLHGSNVITGPYKRKSGVRVRVAQHKKDFPGHRWLCRCRKGP